MMMSQLIYCLIDLLMLLIWYSLQFNIHVCIQLFIIYLLIYFNNKHQYVIVLLLLMSMSVACPADIKPNADVSILLCTLSVISCRMLTKYEQCKASAQQSIYYLMHDHIIVMV
jgi:hypothetical protein